MYDNDDLQPDGKIINNSFSTFTPKIKTSVVRLLIHHEPIGCLTRLALFLAIPFVIFAVLKWPVLATLFGLLTAAVVSLVVFITRKTAPMFENAVLTAAVVASEEPLQLLALANLNNGGSDRPILALQLVSFTKIPCHECLLGEVIPCVSYFYGDRLDRWDGFFVEPLSYATGDLTALQKNIELLDAEDLEILRKHLEEKDYPTERREVQIIEYPRK